jgi:hypothetical protein
MEENKTNSHLTQIFSEVLPALTNANIKYWVFGGVGIAGIVGKFLRENQDVDVYVLEDDFSKTEKILRELVEKHGDWDADRWVLSYSMMKKTKRPKLELSIKGVERFSVVPVYKISDGIEFRVIDILKLSKDALVQEQKSVNGFQFYSPPKNVLLDILRRLIEIYISHYKKPELPKENSKHMIDSRAVFSKEELNNYMKRFEEKVKLTQTKSGM